MKADNNNKKSPKNNIKKNSDNINGDNTKLKNNKSDKSSGSKIKKSYPKGKSDNKASENNEKPISRRAAAKKAKQIEKAEIIKNNKDTKKEKSDVPKPKKEKRIKKIKSLNKKENVIKDKTNNKNLSSESNLNKELKDKKPIAQNINSNKESSKKQEIKHKSRSEMTIREINKRNREFARKHANDFGINANKKALHIYLTVIAVILLVYLGYGFVNYSNKLLPGTIVEGIDCGNMTSQECIDAITDKINSYSLAVKKNGEVIDVIKTGNVNLKPSSAMPNKIREMVQHQNKLVWLYRCFSKPVYIDLEGVASVDASSYYNFMKSSKGYNLTATVPAAMYSFVFEKGKFQLAEPNNSDEIDRSVYSDKVMKAMENLDNDFEISKNDCYVKINNTDSSIKANYENACKKANGLINYGSLRLNVEGFSGDLAKEIIENSIVVDSNYNVKIDHTTITNAVNKLSEKYNTKGGNRQFKTSVGNMVPVKGGDYGCSLDFTGVADLVEKALLKGGTEVMALNYTRNLMNNDQTGIGDTYIEIDLTNQYAWMYVNGKLMSETPCVTGMADGIHETSEGAFILKNKKKNVALVGEDYVNPVEYWLQIDGGIGLYDAVWMDKFGGDVYKTKGTRGGVALPSDKAEEFYKYAVDNMPVVFYKNTRLPDKFMEKASTGVIAGQSRSLTSEEKTMLENIKNGQSAGKNAIYDGVKSNDADSK